MALATAGRPLTAAQTRASLGEDLAYTTVMTVLGRLYEKGLVARERVGRAFAYRWVPDGAELAAHQMSRLLDGEKNRAAVLSHFVDVLSPQDEALLAELLRRSEQGNP
jgi:predicted transcriptional regulator